MTNEQLAALSSAIDLAFKHADTDCTDCVFDLASDVYGYIRSMDGVEEEAIAEQESEAEAEAARVAAEKAAEAARSRVVRTRFVLVNGQWIFAGNS